MGANANGQFREDEVVVRRTKINGEWGENRYVKIGGKLRVLHQENEQVSIMTEILRLDPDYVVCRATVQTAKGTFTGIGVATLKMDSRIGDAIVSLSETRAVARACRHAGYAMDSCGAEELAFAEMEPYREQTSRKEPDERSRNDNGKGKLESKASHDAIDRTPASETRATESAPVKGESKPQGCGFGLATQAQCRPLYALTKRAQYTQEDIDGMLSSMGAASFQDLSREAASQLIGSLQAEVAA
jgi:hypothetical protein